MSPKKLATSIIVIFLLYGCSLGPTWHVFSYEQTDNTNIKLINWEYSDHRNRHSNNQKDSYGNMSYSFSEVGDHIQITWHDIKSGKTETQTIPINTDLPFNMKKSEIRLSFNESNKPEIYIFYESPSTYKNFIFKQKIYRNKRIRMIYPEVREIEIEK